MKHQLHTHNTMRKLRAMDTLRTLKNARGWGKEGNTKTGKQVPIPKQVGTPFSPKHKGIYSLQEKLRGKKVKGRERKVSH